MGDPQEQALALQLTFIYRGAMNRAGLYDVKNDRAAIAGRWKRLIAVSQRNNE